MENNTDKELEEALRRLEEAEREFDRKWKEIDLSGLLEDNKKKS